MPFPEAAANLPEYRSHKIVRAVKIAQIEWSAGGATIVPQEWDIAPFYVTANYCAKHQPKAGGYYVAYDDATGGYESWSPAEAFETGYARI